MGVGATGSAVDRAWLPELGVRWSFGVDGISVPLVLLTALMGLVVTAHAWVELPAGGTPASYLGCLLLVEAGALATFTARDAVLFFVAFEVVLVPMWVLIGRYGDPHHPRARTEAAQRFVLYTAVGSTTMLVGILLLVASAGTSDLRALAGGGGLGAGTQLAVAALLVAGLAVKVPVFPLHTWLPPAHTTAPTGGSVLLAAVLLKMGTYGLVRLPVAVVPDGFGRLAPVLAVAGAVGILWGGLVCLVERDLKRLVAYSSVAHMGFVVLALASGSDTGLQAALYANVAHGVVSALLFVLVGGLKARWGDVDLAVRRPALRETSPRLGFVLVLGLAASLGLPGLAGFWGELLAVYSAWRPAPDRPGVVFLACAVAAALGAALAAAYALRVAGLVWVGDRPEPRAARTARRHGRRAVGARGARRARRRARGGADGPALGDGRGGRGDRGRPVSALVDVDPVVLAPALAPVLGVVVVLLGDAVRPGRRGGRWALPVAAVLLVLGAAAAVRATLTTGEVPLRTLCLPAPDGACLWTAGPRTSTLQAGILLAAAAALALLHDGRPRPRDRAVTATLLLAATTGGVAVAAARDLGSWLVALELATVPAVALVALRGTRPAAHGALSLLVTSLASFALLVLGAGLWLTATGDATFSPDTVALAWADPQRRTVLVLAVTLLVGGLGFKLSLVPFHAWTPQAYATADLGTALFLAAASKLAAAAALFVVVSALVGAVGAAPAVVLVLGVLAAASLLLGTVVALRQDDPVRLLAWSTIAQAGWVVVPLTALTEAGVRAAAAYVLTYAAATTVAFAALSRTRARRLEETRGLLRRDPLAGGALALALLVLAGLPPGVLGLVVKVLAVAEPVARGVWPVAAVAVVAVVVGIAVYLRWFAVLFARDDDAPDAPAAGPAAGRSTTVVLAVGTAVLAVGSALPHALLAGLG